MNINKHMEAIFLTTLAVAGAGSFAIERLPDAAAETQAALQMRAEVRAALPAENNIGTPGHMAVIVVRGHRPARGA